MMRPMRILEVWIETFSGAGSYRFQVDRAKMPTFLINPHPIQYYSFETLAGTSESFLYSDIKHISLKEV